MTIFAVRYEYDAEESTLAPLRPPRMEFFRALAARGVLLASGQLRDGNADGMLVLQCESAAQVAPLLDDDPYVVAGVVSARTIEEWVPTVGTWVGRPSTS